MKRLKTIISLILVVVMPFSFSVHAAVQPQISATETATRICEVETLRETNSETYLLSDGTYECVVYAEDKYYLDNSQSLRLIDNSITRVDATTYTTSGQYKNTANAFDVYFSDSGTPEVNIIYNENGISFTPAVTASKKGVQANPERSVMTVGKVENCTTLNELTSTGSNTVVYKNAFRDTDLVYVLENSALKEYIILNSANAPNEFSFMFTLDNVTMKNADGNAYFTAADGTTIFALDSLFAVDANGAITENLIYSSAPVANTNEVLITVTLDKEYLSSSNRAFPVIIDPTITVSSSETADACVCSYTPNTNYQMATQLRTGYEPDYGIRRSFIKFNIPSSVPANCVTNATLDIEKLSGVAPTIRAYRCLSSWSSSTITWNNMPSFTLVNASSTSTEYRAGSTWYTMNVTDIVSGWVDGTRPNFGFAIKDLTEDDPDHWTTLYSSDAPSPHKPELIINYSSYYYGSRPYQDTRRVDINCMGYALEYPAFIDKVMLGVNINDMNGMDIDEMEEYIEGKVVSWMNSNIGSSNWEHISAYNSGINTNCFRVILRVGFIDFNNNGLYDPVDGINGDLYDYHWWYQTSSGDWADKLAKFCSEYRSGTAGLDPAEIEWANETLIYSSDGVFFQIQDIRDVAWS